MHVSKPPQVSSASFSALKSDGLCGTLFRNMLRGTLLL